MYTTRILAALATASVAAAQFDALANTNMAVYWVIKYWLETDKLNEADKINK